MSAIHDLIHGPERRIYLAGPMSGIPHFNFPRFNRVAKVLRTHGHTVFNPAEADITRHGGVDLSKDNVTGSQKDATANYGFSIREALYDDLAYICQEANAVVFLPGWERSAGSNAEHRTAVAIQAFPGEDMKIMYLTESDCHMMEAAGRYNDEDWEAVEAADVGC